MISKFDVNHGIAGFLLANDALNDLDEYAIRKQIIINDKIEAIIVFPQDMIYITDTFVTLWRVSMNKNASMVNGRQVRNRHGEFFYGAVTVESEYWRNRHQ